MFLSYVSGVGLGEGLETKEFISGNHAGTAVKMSVEHITSIDGNL